jgi:hypothetical protein
VAAIGCALSFHFVWSLTPVTAGVAVAVTFFVLAAVLNIEKSFTHPAEVVLELKASNELNLDGLSFRLETLWASPLLLILVACDTCDSQADVPVRVRILLGKDAVSDQQWSEIQTWRVWCQRG